MVAKVLKSAKRTEYKDAVQGMKLLGEIITWSPGRATMHKHKDVIAALSSSGLDPQVARAILPKQAFARASKILSNERIIDVLREETDSVVFQFSTKMLKEGEWQYKKEVNLTLNKVTGKVTCTNKSMEEKAQTYVDRYIEARTASDITRIVQKLFEDQADLFPIRDQGGAYFVPDNHSHFSNKVQEFLTNLGGSMGRWPIPAGTQRGDLSVKEAVASGLSAMVQEYEDAIASFGLDTRESTLQAAGDRVRATKLKIEAYDALLGSSRKKLMDNLEKADEKLRSRIKQIAADRTDPSKVRDNTSAKPGITDVILSLLRKASQKKPISKQEILDVLIQKFPDRDAAKMKKTVNGQVHYNLLVSKKIQVSSNGSGGFWVADSGMPSSNGKH